MKYRILTIAAAAVLIASLLVIPAAAADAIPTGSIMDNYSSLMPRSGADTFADPGTPGGDTTGGMGGDTTDPMMDTDTEGNLGDTSGPTESGDGVIDGTADTNQSPMSDMTDTGDTAGTADEEGGNLLGIIITLLVIGAVVILIFALIPKRKS
jgi:hypothetical protein